MQSFLNDFIDYMHLNGCGPHYASDIKADNKRRNYVLHGDPVNKKRGYYKFALADDFAFGYFGDYREGMTYYSWNSSAVKDYDKSKLAEIKKRIKKDAAEEERLFQEKRERAAKDAQAFCLFLDEAESHPYLDKKQIEPCGALKKGANLVLPMHDGDNICNYQIIREDGTKKYYEGAKKTGCFFVIEGAGDVVYVTEGFATGASVHMATRACVYVAFDSGNLEHVISWMLDNIKQTIILAADNDHETTIRGAAYNTGLVAAEKIRKLYGIDYIYPQFSSGDSGCSDFNDLHVKYGLDKLKEYLEGGSACLSATGSGGGLNCAKTTAPAPFNESWKDGLLRGAKNRLLARSAANASLILTNDEELFGCFSYDQFACETKVVRCLPWEDEEDFTPRRVTDHDYIEAQIWLEKKWGVFCGRSACGDLIENIAAKNMINPAREYFLGIEWDGVKRIDTWLQDYVYGAGYFGSQSSDYLTIVGSKFMIGMAKRAISPGCKFDTMLVLEGRQYSGKSMLCRIIGTVNGQEYFMDGIRDINNKDTLMQFAGRLVIEFDEISAMRRAEINDLKGFLSKQSDLYRPPYGRNVIEVPRQCVFIGTVNPNEPYLKDVTGNRRYWPVSCRDDLPLDRLRDIMPQLHAEAAHRAKAGESAHLTKDEYRICASEQVRRAQEDLWTEVIEDYVSGKDFVATQDILDLLGLPQEKKSQLVYTRISSVMTFLGYMPARRRIGRKQLRGFRLASAMEYEDYEVDA